jgi:hypothetical protein
MTTGIGSATFRVRLRYEPEASFRLALVLDRVHRRPPPILAWPRDLHLVFLLRALRKLLEQQGVPVTEINAACKQAREVGIA